MSPISLVKLHTKMENHVSDSFHSCVRLTSYGVFTLLDSADTYADADTDSCTEKVTINVIEMAPGSVLNGLGLSLMPHSHCTKTGQVQGNETGIKSMGFNIS